RAGVRAHLRAPPPPLYPFAAARDELRPSPRRLLICAAAGPDDAEAAVRLVQEVRLRQWPTTVVAVEAGACARNRSLAWLDPFVARRLCLPNGAEVFVTLP